MKQQRSRANLLFTLAVPVTVLSLTACNNLPGRPGPDPVLRPEQVLDFSTLYSENCSGCHGTEGKGGAAVSISDPVYQALVDDAALHRIITNGLPGTLMPAFGQSAGGMLTEQQIDSLVQGMRTHWANPSALNGDVPPPYTPSAPGDAARGVAAFQTFCAMCHGPAGRGGPVAGSIVDGSFLGLVTDQELRTMIMVGVPGTAMPNWRSHAPRPMSSQEISDVVAWLATQRPQFPGQPYPARPELPSGGSQ
jgi:cytochrome c oxidase cbb3-type subunit III